MTMYGNCRWPCCQGNFQVPPTTVFVGGLGWRKCCHGWGVHFHGWQRLYRGIKMGGARHSYDAPEKMISWSSCWQKCIRCYYCPIWEQVCLSLQTFVPCVQVCLYLLPELRTKWNSHKRLTHQSRNSQCNRVDYFPAGCRNLVYTDHSGLPLRSPEDTGTSDMPDKWQSETSDNRWDFRLCLWSGNPGPVCPVRWCHCVYLADAGAAGVCVDAARQVTFTTNTRRIISVSKCTTITLSTCETLLAFTLTCRYTCTQHRNARSHSWLNFTIAVL